MTRTAAFARTSRSSIWLHRAELPPTDVIERIGFRATNPVRSIVDIAATAPDDEQLGRAIVDAVQAGLLTLRTLRSRAESVDVRAALQIERALATGVTS